MRIPGSLIARTGMSPPSRRSHSLLAACLLLAGPPAARAADAEAAIAQNDFAAVEAELESVAADWKTAWEKSGRSEDALEYGRTLQALGIVEREAGKAAEALPHLEQAGALLESAPPAARADIAEALALTRQDLGKAAEAETGLRQVIRLRESLPPGEREPGLSLGRDHLALNLLSRGKYTEAGSLLEEALAATPDDAPLLRARRLGYRARYLHTLGSHSRAAAACREALALSFDAPELRLSLESQLALAQLRLGNAAAARQGMDEAADRARELYRQPSAAFRAFPYLNNLGALDLSLGNAAEARAAFAEALALLEDSVGTDHPSLILPLNNLGCAEQAAGDLEQAGETLRRAADLQAKYLPRVHLRVAETARNLARNALLLKAADATAEIDRATATGIALLDELVISGSEQERLNFLQLMDLVSLPCATGDGARIADVLAATKARLLDAMLDPGPAPPRLRPDWKAIQTALKPGTALVDACRYTTVGAEGEIRYGAIVLLPEGPPKWVPLGSGADLDRWLEAFRKRLTWRAGELAGNSGTPPTLTLRSVLRSLHAGFWEPVARELPSGTEHIAFSPDGALHFLPLPVLLDGAMQPLCTRHRQIVTVTSARDLLGKPSTVKLASEPWAVLGVSEFPKGNATPGEDRLLQVLAHLDSMPGTADETGRLKKIAPRGSLFLQDGAANEAALAGLSPAPGVLHLGCHAFFLPGHVAAGVAVDFDENAELLYSGGLLLHRAALRGPESPLLAGDDDLLFPGEVAKLPLNGTRLVTLSSCESGAGTAVSGEGLLGLRRGFALAGAREVAVALWPVSDRSTPEFMERFYRLALASDRPAQALWQCQREFLSKAKDDAAFEAAVLRYGPFVISQNTPLEAGGEIVVAEKSIPWTTAWALLPLVVFLLARWRSKKRAAQPPL
jgi:CHAT domain-containing protein/tetratricopeptide (TPR) repeat protein